MVFSASVSRVRPVRYVTLAALLALLSGLVAFSPPVAHAAGCNISDISDAINSANAITPNDYQISLTAGCTYTYSGPSTYSDSDSQPSALPELIGTLIIQGNGATIVRADTAPDARIFSIGAAGSLELNNVTISGGTAENGGGIANFGGQLTLSNSLVTLNHASGGFGGGIASMGTAEIRDSTISSNFGTIGGGIVNLGGSMTIESSTINFNATDFGPAQIYNSGPILGDGTLTLVNSTIVGNQGSASDIGVVNIGTFNADNSTIVFNGGGGINNQAGSVQAPSVTTLVNTIVANNGTVGCDASQTSVGGIVDGGHNLDSGDTCGFSAGNGSLSNTDPQFSSGLSDQGGPTQVMPLVPSSPAVDAGDDTVCAGDLVNGLDQRGVARPQGTHCDIGAVEMHMPAVTSADATAQDIDTSATLSATVGFDCGGTYPDCPATVSGTVTFSVTDSGNNPFGTSVSGTISGGSASATFDPSSLAPGTYTIAATYHDSSNTYPDESGTSTLTVTPGPAASVTLSPGDISAPVGQTVIETAIVLDAKNYPVADDTDIQIVVSGANPMTATQSTLNCQVTLGYGGLFAGTDTLTMTAVGGTNPSAMATITWNAPASTPRASLTILGLRSPAVQAVVTVGQTGQPSGSFSYADRTVRLSNVQLMSLVVNGSNATLYGSGQLADGSTVSFQLDVSASRTGGTLRLQLSNGYDTGRFSAPVLRVRT
ncbi:MAG TPA: choice-of-anchor Q domain-containing protein [Nitrolancea sp.]